MRRLTLEIIPIALMGINLLMHSVFIWLIWDYIPLLAKDGSYDITPYFPEWFIWLHTMLKDFFDCSLILIVVLVALSDKWKTLASISLVFLTVLWMVNFVFKFTPPDWEFYYYLILTIIYPTYLLLSLKYIIMR